MRKINFLENNFYHIYNRGNSKQVIFKDESDLDHFKKLLYMCNGKNSFKFRDFIIDKSISAYDFDRGESLVDICLWTLMPNHFHLLLYIPTHPVCGDDGKVIAISEFMRKLLVSYTKYFNEKYKRTGSLYEGSFKAEPADADNYLKYLFSYIHLNPIKLIQKNWKEEGIKNVPIAFDFLEKYTHSSFAEWISNIERVESLIINKKPLLGVVEGLENSKSELVFWLNYKKEDDYTH